MIKKISVFVLVIFLLMFVSCSHSNGSFTSNRSSSNSAYGHDIVFKFVRDNILYTCHVFLDHKDIQNKKLNVNLNYKSILLVTTNVTSKNKDCSEIKRYTFLFKSGQYYVCGIHGFANNCKSIPNFESKFFSAFQLINTLISFINDTTNPKLKTDIESIVSGKLVSLSFFDNFDYSPYIALVFSNSQCIDYFFYRLHFSNLAISES